MIKIQAPESFTRPVSIATREGAAISLRPGEARIVPDYFAPYAVAKRCAVMPVDAGSVDAPDTEVAEAATRDAAIEQVILKLIAEGDPANFTRDKRPKVAVVSERAGFEVGASEIAECFERVAHELDDN